MYNLVDIIRLVFFSEKYQMSSMFIETVLPLENKCVESEYIP